MLPAFESEPEWNESGESPMASADVEASYPKEAKAPDGTLWWNLKIRPGAKKARFGDEKRICAWLWFNKEVDDLFTMRELREKIGGEVAEDAEHFNRRLRELRKCGWQLSTKGHDSSIPKDHYRLDRKGQRIWLKSEAKKANAISDKARRMVIDRDGSRCTVCGVGRGEPYPGEPGTKARLTIGHRVPQERLHGRGTADDIDNLRTECSRCNEPVRDEMPDPELLDEVRAVVRRFKADDRRVLLNWLEKGERTRSQLDRAYDRARKLSYEEQKELISSLKQSLGYE